MQLATNNTVAKQALERPWPLWRQIGGLARSFGLLGLGAGLLALVPVSAVRAATPPIACQVTDGENTSFFYGDDTSETDTTLPCYGKLVISQTDFNNARPFSDGDLTHTVDGLIYTASQWYTTNVTSMFAVFYASDLSQINDLDISGWDTSNVTSLQWMFFQASSVGDDIVLDLNSWDVSKNTTLERFMSESVGVSVLVDKWDTSSVTRMDLAFERGVHEPDLSSWNTSSVTTFKDMFKSNTAFNGDISGWDTSAATNMTGMFEQASSFNQDLSGWNVSNFNGNVPANFDLSATAWILPRPIWTNTSVQECDHTGSSFYGQVNPCNNKYVINQADFDTATKGESPTFTSGGYSPVDWYVSNITDMSDSFVNYTGDHDISDWDVSAVTSMENMFTGATSFNRNLKGWDVRNVTNALNFASGATLFGSNLHPLWGTAGLDLDASTLEIDPASLFIDGETATVTVTAKDKVGTGIVGLDVQGVSKDGSNNDLGTFGDLNGASFTDVGGGLYTATLSSSSAGDATVTAYLNASELPQSQSVTFLPLPDLALSSVAADTYTPSSTGSATLTVTLLDSSSAPVLGYDKLTAVLDDGNTSYTYSQDQSGALAITEGSNGEYSFTVGPASIGEKLVTVYANGESLTHSTNPVTLTFISKPGSPENFDLRAGNAKLVLTWEPPLKDEGAGITDYQYSVDSSTFTSMNGAYTTSVITGVHSFTISPLENGISRTVEIRAVNDAGVTDVNEDPNSTELPSATATPSEQSPPDAPTDLTVTASATAGELNLSWTAPSDNGGNEVTDYQYSLDGGTSYTSTGSATPTQSVSVNNGTAYSVTVRAINRGTQDNGDGAGVGVATDPIAVPSVSLSAKTGVVGASFEVTATFSEAVTGFELGDISVGNGTASNLQPSGENAYNESYTFDVAPTSSGEVTIDIGAGAAEAIHGGINTAAVQVSRTADVTGPAFSSAASVNVAENTTSVITVTATDDNTVTGYAITGGVDAALFVIDTATGALTFDLDGDTGSDDAPDYETPADSDGDNAFVVEITASDGVDPANTTTQTLTVTVTNIVENPAVVIDDFPDGFTVAEAGTATFGVWLAEEPSGEVVLELSSDDPAIATAANLADPDNPTSFLTFDVSNWNVAQTVTVSGTADDDTDDEEATITLSAQDSGGYKDVTGSLAVTATDITVLDLAKSSVAVDAPEPAPVADSDNTNTDNSFTISVTVKDANDFAITGFDVTKITATVQDSEGNTIDGYALSDFTNTNNNDGIYIATLKSTKAQEHVLKVSLDGAEITHASNALSVTFAPAAVALANSSVVADPTTGVSTDASSTVTITVQDAYQNPITGLVRSDADTDFAWTIKDTSGDDIGVANLGTFAETTTAGVYTASLTSQTVGDHVLTLQAKGVELTDTNSPLTVTFVPGAASATTSTIEAADTELVADTTTSTTLTIQAKDQYGNNLTSDASEQFLIAATDGTFSGVTSNGDGTYTPTSQGDGTYTATLTTGTIAKTVTITATLGGTALDSEAEVIFIPGPISSVTSSFGLLDSSTTQYSVDGAAGFYAYVKDKNGNTIGGLTWDQFEAVAYEPGTNTLLSNSVAIKSDTFTEITTDSPRYNFDLTSQVAQAYDIRIMIDVDDTLYDLQQTARTALTFIPGAADASQSSASNETSNTSAVVPSSTFTLYVNDQFGNPIPGLEAADFSWTVKDGSDESAGDITGAALSEVSETNPGVSGVYETTLTSPSSGDHYVRIYVGTPADGVELTDTVNPAKVTFVTEPDAPSDFSVAQGDASLTLTWTAPNDNGSAITGYEYSLDKGLNYTATGSTANTFTTPTLTNGTTYEVQVRAINAVDAGAASDTITLTPAATDAGSLYDSDTCVPIVASDTNVTLTGATPTSDGSGAYQWTGDLTFTFSSPLDLVLAPHSSSTVANFENGASYVVDTGTWVQTLGSSSITYALNGATISGAQTDADAANANWGHFDAAGVSTLTLTSGGSDADAVTLCRIPAAPGAPTNLSVTPGDGELTLSWDAPLDDGGPDISAYKYNLDGGSTYTPFTEAATATTQVLSLANGESYTVSVLAVNGVDDGAASAAVTVPSVTLATSVDGVVGGTFTVTATFSEPVTDFDLDDVSVANADEDNFQTTGTVTTDGGKNYSDTYTFEVTPTLDAASVTIDVAAGAALTTAGGANTQALQLSRTADLTGPAFTSDAAIESPENTTTAVVTLAATDTNGPVTYAITGGDDEGDFTLNTSTAELTFNTDGANGAADYETPADADENNVYTLEVTASDAATPPNTTTQTLSVTVTNILENPALDISKASLEIDENDSGTFTLALAEEPAGDVTVTVSSSDGAAASVSSDDDTTPDEASVALTFTIANWDTAQTVTVTGVEDHDSRNETETITLTPTDGGYGILTAATVSVSVTDNDTPGITVSETSVSMNEGANGSFTVKLTTQPSGDVTVTVSSSDVDAASVSEDNGTTQAGSVELTFTSGNWNQTQTVTVTGVEDDDTRDETPSISFGVAGEEYNTLDVTDVLVSVSVTDNDSPGLTVSATDAGVSMDEGATDSFTVKLNTQPSGDVTVTVSSDDGAAASVSSDGGATQAGSVDLTFTVDNWATEQTVTVTGVEDDDTRDETPSISFGVAGEEYNTLDVTDVLVSVSVTDNDSPGLTVSATDAGVSMDEGATDSFTVKLNTQPSGDVTVTVSSDDGAAASVSSDGGATQAGSVDLTFTVDNWATEQTVTVTGVEDDDTRDETPSISFGVAGEEYNTLDVTDVLVSVSVTDNDSPGLTVSATDAGVSMDEGATDSFTVKLNTQPSGDVTVTVSSDDGAAASVSSDGGATQAGSVDLTFTVDNWATEQTVTVTGVEDDDTRDETPSISFGVAGEEYNTLDVTDVLVSVSVTDNDSPGLTVSATDAGVSMDEGATDSFTVKLNTQPSGDVTVTVSSDDGAAASVSSDGGATQAGSVDLTFTVDNWATEQTVTVTGVEDDDTRDETPSISFGVAGEEYNTLDVTDVLVSVSVTDNDSPGLTVSATDAGVSMDEGATDSFTVKLNTQPSGDVTVTVSSDDGAAASVSSDGGATQAGSVDLTFTVDNWATEQTVTVTGVEDDDTRDETPSISFGVAGEEYNTLDVTDVLVSVSVTDNDSPGLTVSATDAGVSMDEGATDSFTVKLNTQPSGDVTVTVSSDDGAAASVSSDGGATQAGSVDLTFTVDNWATEQTVTVTGVEDDDTLNETPSISFGVAGEEYNTLDVTDVLVSVSVTDNDSPGLTVSATDAGVSMDEGATDSFTVKLNTQPSGDVTVTVSSDDGAAASVSSDGGATQAGSVDLTFTVDNWATEQTVTVTGVEDDDTRDETPSISFGVAGEEYNTLDVTDVLVSVSVTDNDSPGLTVSATDAGVSMDEGATDSFTVKLNTQPSGDVTVTVSSDDGAAASVSSDGGATQAGSVDLTFTVDNWATEQTVTVTGVEDDDTRDETPSISFGVAGEEYNTLDVTDVLVSVSVTDNDSPGLTVSATDAGVSMDEGATDSFTVKLNTQPSGDVTVTVSSDDGAAASVSSDGGATQAGSVDLTFTVDNWATEQTVTVTGVEDDDTLNETPSISFGVAGEEYNTLDVTDVLVSVSVTDNDSPGLTVSATDAGVSMDEGATDSFTVKLNTQPSGDVTVTVSSDDGAAASVSSDGGATQAGSVDLTFTVDNWATEQTVTVTGVEDDDTLNETPSISFGVAGEEYNTLDVTDVLVSVSVTDNDSPGLTVSATDAGVSMDEGATDSFTVKLNTQPSGDVTVTVSSDDGAAASVSSDGGATQAGSVDLTFTVDNWATEQTVTVTGVEDDDTRDETPSISFGVAGEEYNTLDVTDVLVSVSVTDNDSPGLTVSATDAGVSMDEGATDSFTVKLNTQPSGDVTVTVSSDDGAAASVSSDGGATQAGSVDLTFTVDNWATEQTVTVTGVEDDDTRDETPSISFGVAGEEYNTLDVTDVLVSVSVTDNDSPGLTVSATDAGVSMDEGATDSFTVKLNTQPSGDVTVTVSSDDGAAASVSSDGGATQAGSVDLTFTVDNWATEQTVTVTGVEDDDTRDETPSISFGVAGEEYNTLDVTDVLVSVSVTDNDSPGLTVSATDAGVSMDEGATDSFTVKLNTQPSGDVTVTVSSDDGAAASVSSDGGATQAGSVDLTFTVDNWATEQTVTVTGVEDDDTRDETPSISFGVAGEEYNTLDVTDVLVSVSVTDNDSPGLTVSATDAGVSMDEGATDSFTVKLNTQPSGDVTVTVSSDDGAAASVSSDGGATQAGSVDLTFTVDNWATEQTVTVTGVEDDDTRDETPSISFGVAGQEYNTLDVTAVSVGVSVTDDDTPGITVSETSVSMLEQDTDTFTVALTTEPSGDVTVTVSSDDGAAANVSKDGGATQAESIDLTFTSTNWNSPQTVTVTGVQDSDTNDEELSITFAVTGAVEYHGMNPDSVSVEVADNSVAGIYVLPSNVQVDEGGTSSFEVGLTTQPNADVTMTIQSGSVAAALVSSEGAQSPAESVVLTFKADNWATEQTVTVTGVQDDDMNEATASISVTPSGGEYDDVEAESVSVTVVDTSVPAISVSTENILVKEGTAETFTVVLDTQPNEDVTVSLSSSDVDAATVSSDGGQNQSRSIDLTFTASNWNRSQTVTVTGVEDSEESQRASTITLDPSGGGYDGVQAASIEVTVDDNDDADLVLSTDTLTLTEGRTKQFTVVLQKAPDAEVTVTLSPGDALVEISSDTDLTFSTTNWETPQLVTVKAVDNEVVGKAESFVTFVAASDDSGYNNLTASLPVTIEDDDAGFALSTTSVTVNEGSAATFTVALEAAPSTDVVVSLSSSDPGAATLDPETLTFTTADWADPQSVLIRTTDNDNQGDRTLSISLTATGGSYDDASGSLSLKISDDDGDPDAVSDPDEEDATTPVADASRSTLSSSVSSLDADGEDTATLTVRVRDADGNNLTQGGDRVVFATSAGQVSATVDQGNGTYTATLTSGTQPTVATLSATVNGGAVGNSVQVEFVQMAPDEDGGAVISSIANSQVMSAQLGSLVSDAAIGGLSSGVAVPGLVPSSATDGSAGGGLDDAGDVDAALASVDTSAYRRLNVVSARDGEDGSAPLVDWFSTGISRASVDAELNGDGVFGYAVVGSELSKDATSVSGLLYGAEASSWNYDGETDVDRAGASIGYYSARRAGDLIYTGSSIVTLSRNEFESETDATGNANSLRLILKGELSGQQALPDGGTLTPFTEVLYSTETLDSFTFSDGITSDEAQVSIGRLGSGVEYITPELPEIGRLTLRGELSQVFGAEDVTLSDGTIYSPNEAPVGAISVGWIGNNDDGSTTRIDLTFGELGNDENEEIRLDGTWDRSF